MDTTCGQIGAQWSPQDDFTIKKKKNTQAKKITLTNFTPNQLSCKKTFFFNFLLGSHINNSHLIIVLLMDENLLKPNKAVNNLGKTTFCLLVLSDFSI